MKKLVLLSVSVISIAFFVSCEKEELKNESLGEKDVLKSVFVNDAGMLEFKDFEEFGNFLDEIVTLSDDEYSSWERAKGFYSYRTRIEETSEDMDCIVNEYKDNEDLIVSNIMEYVRNNSDILKCTDLGNGESSIDYIMPSSIYFNVMNKDGYYAIGDSTYRVGPDKIYSVRKRDAEILNVNNIEMLNGFDNLTTFQYIQPVKTEQSKASCAYGNIYQNSYMTTDRAVTIRLYLETVQSGNYNVYFHVYVYGQKKLAGSWVGYKTTLSYKDVYGVAVCAGNSASCTLTDVIDVENVKKLEAYVLVYGSSTNPTTYFSSIHGKATSRGVGSNWAIIDCN